MTMAGREQPTGRIPRIVPGPERFLGRQRRGGAPRGGVPVLRGTAHASQAWRRALRARQQVVRLPALRRPPHFGVGGDAVAKVSASSPAEASATAAQMRRNKATRRDNPDAENAPRERDGLRVRSRGGLFDIVKDKGGIPLMDHDGNIVVPSYAKLSRSAKTRSKSVEFDADLLSQLAVLCIVLLNHFREASGS